MEESREPIRAVPVWAEVLLAIIMLGCAVVACWLRLSAVAGTHNASLTLFGMIWPTTQHPQAWRVGTVVIGAAALAWFVSRYDVPGRRFEHYAACVFWSIAFIAIVTVMVGSIYAKDLARKGIGTMQLEVDQDYVERDMTLQGNLGFYGGYLMVDGEPQMYICRQIDTFGPFSEQMLRDTPEQPFSEGYEEYARFEQDGLMQIQALSVQHYQDGYWLVVKRLVRTDDLHIELDTLDDLRRYIVQMQYSWHSGDEAELAQQYAELTETVKVY